MSENNHGADYGMSEQWAAMAKFWTDLTSQVATASVQNAFEPPPEVARRIRDAVFRVMSEYVDGYLRSPQFLESTKQAWDVAYACRRQANDAMTATRHDFQGTAKEDVDTLLRSVKHLETRLLDRMEEIQDQLEAIRRDIPESKRGPKEAPRD